LRRRRFGAAVRLEVSTSMPAKMVEYFTTSLGLTPDDVYVIDGPFNIPDLMQLYQLDLPALKDKPLQSALPAPLLQAGTVFAPSGAGTCSYIIRTRPTLLSITSSRPPPTTLFPQPTNTPGRRLGNPTKRAERPSRTPNEK
jgi:polyphosphate kinase